MEVQIDWLGVVAAAAAAMVIGSLWYSKALFGTTWQKLVGLKENDMKNDAAPAMVKAALLALLTAYVLNHLMYLSYSFFGYSWIQTGLTTAFWVWAGFVFTALFMNGTFERRDSRLTFINAGYWLVNLVVMGLVLGIFLGS